jgi:hypothetical protein
MQKIAFKRETINYPEDYESIYHLNWRYWLQEYESRSSRRYFKKSGYPKHLEKV